MFRRIPHILQSLICTTTTGKAARVMKLRRARKEDLLICSITYTTKYYETCLPSNLHIWFLLRQTYPPCISKCEMVSVPCIRGAHKRSMRASLEDEVRAMPNHRISNSEYTAILRAPFIFDLMCRGSDLPFILLLFLE